MASYDWRCQACERTVSAGVETCPTCGALDPFVRVASMKMQSGEPLNDEEEYSLRFHLIAHIRLFENYFTQYVLGTMDDGHWAAMQQVMRAQFMLEPYRAAFLLRESMWNAEFAEEIKKIVSGIDESAA